MLTVSKILISLTFQWFYYYFWNIFISECKTDQFGEDCKFTCHCLNGSCPRETGKCNGDCEPGWLTETCSQRMGIFKYSSCLNSYFNCLCFQLWNISLV